MIYVLLSSVIVRLLGITLALLWYDLRRWHDELLMFFVPYPLFHSTQVARIRHLLQAIENQVIHGPPGIEQIDEWDVVKHPCQRTAFDILAFLEGIG